MPVDVKFPYSCTLFLPSADFAPKLCRDFVIGVLPFLGFGHLADRAALCTSEIVTNVHRHAGGLAQLRLTAEPDHVRIAVYDGSSALPALRAAGDGDEGGRGRPSYALCRTGAGSRTRRWGCSPKACGSSFGVPDADTDQVTE